MKAVPATRFALGVAGIVASVAIVQLFRIDFGVAALAVVAMFVLMTALVIFARLSALPDSDFRLPGLVFTWAALLLVLACAFLLFLSAFVGWPLDFKIFQSSQPPQTSGEPVQHDLKVPSTRSDSRRRPTPDTDDVPPAPMPRPKDEAPSRNGGSDALSRSFQALKGKWVSSRTTSKEVFYDPYLGHCTVTVKTRTVIEFRSIDVEANAIVGSLSGTGDSVAVFVPPAPPTPEEYTRGECYKAASGQRTVPKGTGQTRGQVVAAINKNNSAFVKVSFSGTHCTQTEDCLPKDAEIGLLELVNDELHIGEGIYVRD